MREEHFILQHLLNMRSEIDLSGLVAKEPVYVNPTNPVRYDPVLPSDGNRKPAEKSPFNYRGYVPSLDGERTMPFESDVERRAGHIFKADRDVVELRAQWPTCAFEDADGERHTHTFDFWVRRMNGERVVVAAKPLEKIVSTNLVDTLRRIRKEGVSEFADRISLVDEAFANEVDDANARAVLFHRPRRNEEEYAATSHLVAGISGAFLMWDLVRIAPVPSDRITAIWNLIYDGALSAVAPGLITFSSLLRSTI